MGRITISETVDAPVETVFAYVDDHKNTTKYMQGLTKWKPAGDITHGKGAKFETSMKAGPSSLPSVVSITAWTENKTIAWRAIEGFKHNGRWAFKSAGESTDVTFEMEYEFGGGIAGRMLARATESMVRSNLQRSVKTLKQQTERLASRRPAAKSGAKPAAKSAAKTAAKRSTAGGGRSKSSASR